MGKIGKVFGSWLGSTSLQLTENVVVCVCLVPGLVSLGSHVVSLVTPYEKMIFARNVPGS